MWYNVGGKCKSLAQILFWLECVLSTIGIIVLISILGWYDGNPAFLLLLPICYLVSWISSLQLYAIGDIWEQVNSYYIQLNRIEKKLEKQVSEVKEPLKTNSTVDNINTVGNNNVGKPVSKENGWKCKKCGALNNINQAMCDCGMSWMKNKTYSD